MSIGEVTNVQAAFEMLLEEIEAEIELTTRGVACAATARDFHRSRDALDMAERVTAFRDRMAEMRKEWHELAPPPAENASEEDQAVERRSPGRLRRGLRTPEEPYFMPILQALEALGGAGRIDEVLLRVERSMKDVLKDVDHEPLASDPEMPRWHNTAQWARYSMVKEGLLEAESRRGVWTISPSGRQLLASGNVAVVVSAPRN